MDGIGCGTSGVGIAGLRGFAKVVQKISPGSTGRLWMNWSRNKNLLARITRLMERSQRVHRSFAAKNAAQDDKGLTES